MRRRAELTLLVLMLWQVVPYGNASAQERPALRWLRQRLNDLATDPRLTGAHAAFAVLDLAGGQMVASYRETESVSIASNAKLFTAATALSVLSPSYRFKTGFYAARLRGGKVVGNLYVKGYGDPSLREETIWRIARDLAHAGLREVGGGIVLDEAYLDGQRLPPLFGDQKTDAYYRPAVGALSLEENAVWIGARAGPRKGSPAEILLVPQSDYLRIEGRVRTVGRRGRQRFRATTHEYGERTLVRVAGTVPARPGVTWLRKRIADPGLHFARALQRQLRAQGIRLNSDALRRARVPRRAQLIHLHQSKRLATVISSMNKTSSNATAELLLKVVGAETFGPPGSSAKGLHAVRDFLDRIGLDPTSYTMRNGSGLYDSTGFSARQVVRLLREVRRDPRFGAEMAASLSIAGMDGTLKSRYEGSGAEGYVRAKTGTLARVVALSGYAGASNGASELAFAIFLTELPEGAISRARDVADEMAQAMVVFLEHEATERARNQEN